MFEKCFKQYVAETTNFSLKIWTKFKNIARNILKREFCTQQNLFELFQSSGHTDSIEDVRIRFIDKSFFFTHPFIPKYKNYKKQTFKTLTLYGLNNEKVYNTLFCIVF